MNPGFWQAVLFDFDGVVLDSNPARTEGFRRLFSGYPESAVEALLRYHEENGGLSRYDKIAHFFKDILKRDIPPGELGRHAERFSSLVKQAVIDSPFIPGAAEYFGRRHPFPLYLVSGSDQDELREICGRLGIASSFAGIFGSPTPKTENVARILSSGGYPADRVVLIGDSRNDQEAARANRTRFIARASGRPAWLAADAPHIQDLSQLDQVLCDAAGRG
ncbi:MAG TPA: hypothetical protein DCM05_02690 [Elusimicrobia bacterium]|nr:hypothetical protein [Elusimicrobiota bacterium]